MWGAPQVDPGTGRCCGARAWSNPGAPGVWLMVHVAESGTETGLRGHVGQSGTGVGSRGHVGESGTGTGLRGHVGESGTRIGLWGSVESGKGPELSACGRGAEGRGVKRGLGSGDLKAWEAVHMRACNAGFGRGRQHMSSLGVHMRLCNAGFGLGRGRQPMARLGIPLSCA